MFYKYKNKKYEGPDQIEFYTPELNEVSKKLSDKNKEILFNSSRWNNIPMHKHWCWCEYWNDEITAAYIESFKEHGVNVLDYWKEVE